MKDLLGRTGRGEEAGAESGFTLIELMVVLLIMAILLAIAIPTFLSVTNGAKKTATQSDLTNALQSATAIYTRTQAFPTTGFTFLHAMAKTQTTITFIQTGTPATKGKNVLSLGDKLTGSLVMFAGEDGATWCWAVFDNQSNAHIAWTAVTVPPGDHFTGYRVKSTTATNAKCTVNEVVGAARTLATNFKTINGT